jgi:hypothetical protein
MPEVLEQPKAFHYCPATVSLIKFFGSVDHHDIIAYSDLKNVCNRDCRSGWEGYGPLKTAIKRMLDDGKVFKVISGQGVKRLTADEAQILPAEHRHRAGRVSRKGIRIGQAIRVADISEDKRTEHLTNLAQHGAMLTFSTAASHRKMLAASNGHPREIDSSKLLDVFR